MWFFIPKRTKYFVFTRTEPSTSDYLFLISVCEENSIQLMFKTVTTSKGLSRIVGSMVCLGSVTQPSVAALFGNFLVSCLPREFENGEEWMDGVACVSSGPVFDNFKGHPYVSVKRNIFSSVEDQSRIG